MTEWPDHSQELSRKSLDYLNDAAFENAEGRLSDVELWLITDALCTVSQGLTVKEDWDVLYAVREELGAKLGKVKQRRK